MEAIKKHNDKLEILFAILEALKVIESEAKERRVTCEEKIASLIAGPESGSKTVTLESGRKITVKRGISYSADLSGIDQAQIRDAPKSLWMAPIRSKTTRELDVEGYEWYKKNDPVAFAAISEFVKTKPKKVAVTIKEKKED